MKSSSPDSEVNNSLKVIGFDADDTLWANEKYFRESEKEFCDLMKPFASEEDTMKVLFDAEMNTLPLYGYGIKGFVLSMIEAAGSIAKEHLNVSFTHRILEIGKQMLQKPVELLDQVDRILEALKPKYKLVLVTKGDLLDQERKLKKSGLEHYFHHIEIMSEKKEADYLKLISHLDILPEEFLMVGNSLKSDVVPLVNINSQAIYIPHEMTWQHERVEVSKELKKRYHKVENLSGVLNFL